MEIPFNKPGKTVCKGVYVMEQIHDHALPSTGGHSSVPNSVPVHNHTHTHSHMPQQSGDPEQTRAALDHMIQHNRYHAEEMAELLDCLPKNAQNRLMTAIDSFEAANFELQEVLNILEADSCTDGSEMPEVPHHHHDPSHPHGHHHDPAERKRRVNRLSRMIGHLEYVKRMINNDEDCSSVLMQILAIRSALNGLTKEIINEHMSHCVTRAIESGDTEAVEKFKQVIQRYL